MSINAGGSAVTGVYLGDELLTGGGNLDGIIQTAISKPVSSDLGRLLTAPTEILESEQAMTALANDKAALDAIVANPNFIVMVQAYPEIRTIIDQSPYKTDYLPGPLTLKKGDQQKGYFGETESSEFGLFTDGSQSGYGLDATTLAAQLDITQGNMMNNSITWQKFYWQGYIWYIASKAIRYYIAWNTINDAGAVTGKTPLKLTKGTFYPYLLTGGVYDSTDDIGTFGDNMWDQLLRGLLSGGYWDTAYTDAQLDFRTNGNGYYHWCQETNGSKKQLRYGSGGAGANTSDSSNNFSTNGWRPALRFTP